MSVLLLVLLLSQGMQPLAAAPIPAPSVVPARDQGGYHYYLVGIEVSGAQRLKRQDVVALSGLRTGRTVEPRDIEVAQSRLAGSGLFAQVGTRLRTTGGGYSLIVTFVVQEPRWDAPVFFDNFVGFTDSQLRQTVAAAVPTFDGFVPESPIVFQRVASTLERLAREAAEPGTVSWLLVDDKVLGLRRYRFHLDRTSGPVKVCAIDLTTAGGGLRDRMAMAVSTVVGSDYSKDSIVRHAIQNVLPVATSAGYLRARIGEVGATREPTSRECTGVRVTMAIEVGLPYEWRTATWMGNAAFDLAGLDRLLAMAPGDPADAAKIDRGFRAVSDAYRNKGYLRADVRPEPEFDDATRRVAYTVRIAEGPQFRMGALTMVGFEPPIVEALKALWKLPEGEVFDLSYSSRFAVEARAKLRGLVPSRSLEILSKPDVQRSVVDVTVTAVPKT